MRILRVIQSMNPKGGGPSQGIRNLVPAIDAQGHTNEVVCLDSMGAEYRVRDPFLIHQVGEGKGPLRYCRRLKPWLEANIAKYDVVIIHGLWQYHSMCVTNVLVGLKQHDLETPSVFLMPHGMLDPWFQQDKSRRIKAWRNWVYWKLIEHKTIENVDGVLFTCQKELELARDPFHPYRPKRELNVGYGVAPPPPESELMKRAIVDVCPQLEGQTYLLSLSRIHPKKGVDLLIEAYARFAETKQYADMPTLVIAGPTDSQFAKAMQQRAETHGLLRDKSEKQQTSAGIVFPGMLQGDAKWGAFYGCEAFILPSHQENFGIAVVEALACGKPVLLSDQVNIYSDIESDGAAFVGSDTPEGTEALLRAWMSTNEESRKAMSLNAKACYKNRYMPTTAAENFLEAVTQE